MFKNFSSNFSEYSSKENSLVEMKAIPFKYSELLLEFGGKTFDHGLYTIHTFKDSLKWRSLLSGNFPSIKVDIISFGHDWMGRQFCVPVNTNECIYMLDPATHEDYVLDENLFDFHNKTLANSKIENLASDLFIEALRYLNISSISYDQCVGFKTPLFLGGKEEVSNYEICDLEIYWDIQNQLYAQINDLPEGTKVSNVAINPFQNKKE